jgi:hypothetical protein
VVPLMRTRDQLRPNRGICPMPKFVLCRTYVTGGRRRQRHTPGHSAPAARTPPSADQCVRNIGCPRRDQYCSNRQDFPARCSLPRRTAPQASVHSGGCRAMRGTPSRLARRRARGRGHPRARSPGTSEPHPHAHPPPPARRHGRRRTLHLLLRLAPWYPDHP